MHLKETLGAFTREAAIKLNDAEGNPTWFQHPKGQDIDLAVGKIDNIPEVAATYFPNGETEATDMMYNVGTDVFIVGFPLVIRKQDIFPVWKRGSIASEPDIPIEDNSVFLVDSATRPGMSGSPVYCRTSGGYRSTKGTYSMTGGLNTRFIGVYSGRYGADDELAAQLGRVWHQSVLDEIIDSETQGCYEIR